jgi:hypothetical protein
MNSRRLICPMLLLLVPIGTQWAEAQVCANATGNANLTGQSSVTIIVPPSVPSRVSANLTSEANTWKNQCQGNTEGIPTFTAVAGTGFGSGQDFHNSILVNWVPGTGTQVNGQYPIASYDPASGTMTLYGAAGGTPLQWNQQSVYQAIAHEIGHALGLDHDNCSPNSMMQPIVGPGQILSIQPGECMLASFVSCDPYSDAKCPTQDPRKPPLNNWHHGGLNLCQQLPDLCPTGNEPTWIVIWDCIATTVTSTDCFSQVENGPCISSVTPVLRSGSSAHRGLLRSRMPRDTAIPPTTWSKDDVTCYPDFAIQESNTDPTPFTAGGTGPAVAILSPTEGQIVAGSFQVSGVALQAITGAGKMAFWLDGLPIQLSGFAQGISAPGACGDPTIGGDPYCPNVGFAGTFDSRMVANGTHTFQAVALDRRSSFPAATYFERHFTSNNSCFDATPPTVSVASPANHAVVSGVVSVSVAASDNVSVAQTSLYIDGAIVAVWSAPPYTFSWDTTRISASSHTLQARAADSCGNTAASSTLSVTALPDLRIYIDIPAPNGTVSGTAFATQGWATDAASIASLSFSVDNGALALAAPYTYGVGRQDVCNAYPGDPKCPNVGWKATFDSTPFSNGAHELSVTATDGLGYQSTANWPIVVSNVPPAGTASTVIWIQPEQSAGYGPPGSLIVAGQVAGGLAGAGVHLWWRDVTAGGSWNLVPYAPPPGSNGIWLNSIPTVNYAHTYAVYATFSGLASSACTYGGNDTINSCP